jgi:polyisoprenoid-binding protein YceI
MRLRLAIPVFLLLASSAWGAVLDGTCEVAFVGTSTLHDFSGKGACIPFQVTLGAKMDSARVEDGQGIRVAVTGMDTANRKRDAKMREMFDCDHFPFVLGTLPAFDPRQLAEKLRAAREGTPLAFDLTIRDITRHIEARALHFREDEKEITFELDFDLSLQEYQLEPPSVLGIIGVGDTVSVKAPFRLRKSERGLWLSKQ